MTGTPDPKHTATSYIERQNLTLRMLHELRGVDVRAEQVLDGRHVRGEPVRGPMAHEITSLWSASIASHAHVSPASGE